MLLYHLDQETRIEQHEPPIRGGKFAYLINLCMPHTHFCMEQVSQTYLSTDNLFELLGKSQTISSQILRDGVVWMVSRLGQLFPSLSLCCLVYPIVQEVVVESKIGGIQNHKEYNRLHKNGDDTEFALLRASCKKTGNDPEKH